MTTISLNSESPYTGKVNSDFDLTTKDEIKVEVSKSLSKQY